MRRKMVPIWVRDQDGIRMMMMNWRRRRGDHGTRETAVLFLFHYAGRKTS